MNVIGKTNGGSLIVGMSQAETKALENFADGNRLMPSCLVVAEVSEKQASVLIAMAPILKKAVQK